MNRRAIVSAAREALGKRWVISTIAPSSYPLVMKAAQVMTAGVALVLSESVVAEIESLAYAPIAHANAVFFGAPLWSWSAGAVCAIAALAFWTLAASQWQRMQPVLEIDFDEQENGFAIASNMTYWARGRANCTSSLAAAMCQADLVKIEHKAEQHTPFQTMMEGESVRLRWAHTGGSRSITISSGVTHIFNVAMIVPEDRGQYRLRVADDNPSDFNRFLNLTGWFRFHVNVSGYGVSSKRLAVEVRWSGSASDARAWKVDEADL